MYWHNLKIITGYCQKAGRQFTIAIIFLKYPKKKGVRQLSETPPTHGP